MTLTLDPYDILVALRPEPDAVPLQPGDDAAFDDLFERSLERASWPVDPSPARRRHRRRNFAIGGIIVAVTGTAGTLSWARTDHERAVDPTMLACHQTADVNSSQIVVSRTAEDPIDTCRQAWSNSSLAWGPMPASVACLLPTGIAAVFPGDQTTCEFLGLHDLDVEISADDAKIMQFEDTAVNAVLAFNACLTPEHVAQILTDSIAEVGLDDWTETIDGDFTPATPCGAMQFDVAGRTAFVRSLPDMYSGES